MNKTITLAIFTFSFVSLVATHVYAKESLKGLPKKEFLSAFEDKMESAWNGFSLLYTRIDPSLKELIPGKEWTIEDRDVSECIYDKMVDNGKLDEYVSITDNLDSIVDVIENNKSITILTMADYPEIQQLNTVEGYAQAMSACGQIKLMQERMQKSGLWEKLTQAMSHN